MGVEENLRSQRLLAGALILELCPENREKVERSIDAIRDAIKGFGKEESGIALAVVTLDRCIEIEMEKSNGQQSKQ